MNIRKKPLEIDMTGSLNVNGESPFLLSVCQEAGIDCRLVWARADTCWDSRPGQHATGGVGTFLNKRQFYTSPNKYILSVQTGRTDRRFLNSNKKDGYLVVVYNALLVYSFCLVLNQSLNWLLIIRHSRSYLRNLGVVWSLKSPT